jgi:hypothetical protein
MKSPKISLYSSKINNSIKIPMKYECFACNHSPKQKKNESHPNLILKEFILQ